MTFTSHKYYYPKKSNSIPISIFIYNFARHRFHHLPIHIKSISVTDYSSTFVFSDLPSVLPANRYKSAVAQLTTSCIMEFFTPVICNAFIHFNWPHSHSKNGHCFYTMPIDWGIPTFSLSLLLYIKYPIWNSVNITIFFMIIMQQKGMSINSTDTPTRTLLLFTSATS